MQNAILKEEQKTIVLNNHGKPVFLSVDQVDSLQRLFFMVCSLKNPAITELKAADLNKKIYLEFEILDELKTPFSIQNRILNNNQYYFIDRLHNYKSGVSYAL